jgi:hypothetical protein
MREHQAEQHRLPAQHSQAEGKHRGQLHVAEAEPLPGHQRQHQIGAAGRQCGEQPAAECVRRGDNRRGHGHRKSESADQRIGQPEAAPIDDGQRDADRRRRRQEEK